MDWAVRSGCAVAGALLGAWAHVQLWPNAPTANHAGFAAALALSLWAVAEVALSRRAASRRQSESRAAAHHDRLIQTFFEHTPTAVAMLDRDLRYLIHSRAWAREFGLGDASLVGRLHYDVFPEVPDRWKQIHRRCLAGASESSAADEFIRADGSSQWIRWACRPWYDTDGSIGGLTFMSHDITSSKRVEIEREQRSRELLKATHEAQAASRAKSEFLANISHEIRTPLTAILGYAQLLKDPALEPGPQADALDRLSAAGSHLASLLDDVLDLTKIEAGRMTVEAIPTDPGAVARAAADMFVPRAGAKGLRLDVVVDANVPALTLADPTRLRQILANLVSNAVKFTAAGSVGVRVRRSDTGEIAFDITDTGIGIDEANLPRLFQPFSQADGSTTRRFGGTGLGLRISRKLAQLMNGDLNVTSRFNEGSTFTLTIPFVEPRTSPVTPSHPSIDVPPTVTRDDLAPISLTAAPSSPPADAGTASLAGRRVLVVDDSPDNLLLAATHLRRAGAIVTCAESGAAAVGASPDRNVAFDLVLLDLHMPDVDGYAALDMLRRVGIAAPIIAFTAYSSTSERVRAIDAGFDGFITKPFTPAAIVEGCRLVLAARPMRRAA